jgi:hypothetical protein
MNLRSSHRALLISATLLVLAACGGGGSESTPTTQTSNTDNSTDNPVSSPTDNSADNSVGNTVATVATLDISSTPLIHISESTSNSFAIQADYSGTSGLSINLESLEIKGINISYSRTQDGFDFTVDADDMNFALESSGNIKITVTDGTLSDEITIPITVKNTSFAILKGSIEKTLTELDQISITNELDGLSVYVADKAYLYGIMNYKERSEWLNDIKSLTSTIQTDELAGLRNRYSELLGNTDVMNEVDAISTLEDIKESALTVGEKFKPIIDKYNTLSIPNFQAPTELSLNLYENNYSLFYGNSALGAVIDDTWVFNTEWVLLQKLIPFNGSLCIAPDNA